MQVVCGHVTVMEYWVSQVQQHARGLTALWECGQVEMIAGSVPTAALVDVLAALAEYMTDCPHLEFLLSWVRSISLRHGTTLQV